MEVPREVQTFVTHLRVISATLRKRMEAHVDSVESHAVAGAQQRGR